MKITSKIVLVIIFAFLIFIGVFEEVFTSNLLKNLQSDCLMLENLIDKNDLQTQQVVEFVDNVELKWIKSENFLDFLIHHKLTQDISVEFVKMKSSIFTNDEKSFRASLEIIKFYSLSYLHFMGANTYNVF